METFFGGPILPVIWAGIMAFVILAYVVLDGFDLGIGMLFLVEKNRLSRDVMVNTVAPLWDGNETWLVLGGAGLYGRSRSRTRSSCRLSIRWSSSWCWGSSFAASRLNIVSAPLPSATEPPGTSVFAEAAWSPPSARGRSWAAC